MLKNEVQETNIEDTPIKGPKKRRVNGRRGSNYTYIERQILIELTEKFKEIIEIKECNMSMIIKKREIWNEIARRYNTAQSSGVRSWQQLRHWYDNHKQVAKKGGLPKPMSQSMFASITGVKTEPEQEAYLHPLFEVKIEEEDEEVKIKDEDDEIRIEDDQDSSQQSTGNEQSDDYSNEQSSVNHRVDSMREQNYQQSMDSYCNEQNGENHRVQSTKDQYCQQSSNSFADHRDNHKVNKLKEQYYREKLKNARLEKRVLLNKKKMELIRHRKEMEIFRLRLKLLQARKR